MRRAAWILRQWEDLARLPKGHTRNEAYWAAVAAVEQELLPTLEIVAAARKGCWTPWWLAREIVDRRAKW
jgi:hypothetical protein